VNRPATETREATEHADQPVTEHADNIVTEHACLAADPALDRPPATRSKREVNRLLAILDDLGPGTNREGDDS
jgi:hypothetical protein